MRKRALAFLSDSSNRKKFYKEWFKIWGRDRLECSSLAVRLCGGNYNTAAEITMILTVFSKLAADLQLPYEDLLYIHKKYLPKFIEDYWGKKVKKNGGYVPHADKTEALKAFLERGFVYDEGYDIGDNYCIRCTFVPLIWPDAFDQHQDALEMAGKIGVPGYTECPLPKKVK